MADRIAPLREADENGIYPTTAPSEQKTTTYLTEIYTSQAIEAKKS